MRNIKVVDYSISRKSSDDVNTSLPFREKFKECKTLQQANVVIASYLNKNLKDMKELEEKIGYKEILLNGDSGVLSDEEIDIIKKENRFVILSNNVYKFYLFEKNNNYITFINIDTPLIDSVEYRSIYVNINESALNYKHWTLEEITPATGNVDDVKVNGVSVVDEDKIANITIPEIPEVPTKVSDLENDLNFLETDIVDSNTRSINKNLVTKNISVDSDSYLDTYNLPTSIVLEPTSVGHLTPKQYVDNEISDVRDDIPEIADNLTTDDSTKTLSAKQGKILNDKINNIISSGNDYIKYDDGTMICYGEVSGQSNNTDYWNFVNRTDNINVSFSVPFINPPIVSIDAGGSDGTISSILGNVDENGFTFNCLKAKSAGDYRGYRVHYIAIGKWK